MTALAADPRDPNVRWAGTEAGVYQINFVFDPGAGDGPHTLMLSQSNPVIIYSR